MKTAALMRVLIVATICIQGCDAPGGPTTAKAPRPGAPAPPPPPPQVPAPSAEQPAASVTSQSAVSLPAGKLSDGPSLTPSDPNLPVIGPLDIKDFAQEFKTDVAAATKKYEKRRIRLIAGEVSGITSKPSGSSGTANIRVSAPMSEFKYNVVLLLDDSRTDWRLSETVLVEGDFQYVKFNDPHFANCTVTKLTP